MTKKPHKGNRANFTSEDGQFEPRPPSSVTGLRFEIKARSGGDALIDFTDLEPRPLAISVAQAIRRLAEIGGPLGARTTIQAYANAVRIYFTYLLEEAAEVRSVSQIESKHIDGFHEWLDLQNKTGAHGFMLLSKMVSIFREIDGDYPTLISTSLRDRLRYTSTRPFERSQPRDAYSPYVARQLRDAARADIVKLLRRIDGAMPERFVDHSDPDVYQRAVVMHEAVQSRGFLPSNDKLTTSLYRALYARGLPTSSLLDDVYSKFHITNHDLPALLTLLSLETGLEIECVKSLKIDCLENANNGTVSVSYFKRRAHGLAHKSMRVRDGGPLTAGGLIRSIVKMTERARQFYPTEALFLYYSSCSFHDDVRYPQTTLVNWIKRHSIVDDKGQPLNLLLSRLRKTHKALWYLKTGGHMARFAVGHTVEIAAKHYADIPSLRPLHEATIEHALQDASRTVVKDEIPSDPLQLENSDSDSADNPSIRHEDVVGSKAPISQDVWLASCTGFYDSPFSKSGTPCSHPFWGCLECRNAVITEGKLPAIIGFLDFILRHREGLDADDWAVKFGTVHARITQQILPSFASDVVEQARKAVEVKTSATYLPPEATQ